MTPEEIARKREELDREYDRLLPDTVLAVVAALVIMFVAVAAGMLASGR